MKIFDHSMVKDPQYFRDGSWISACSDHLYFASEADMLEGRSEFAECLNGLWKFHYAKNYESAIKIPLCKKLWIRDQRIREGRVQMRGLG